MPVKDMLGTYVTQLIPPDYDRDLARTRRERLAATLKASHMDAGYLFESGSWSHGTAISNKSDVDYMAWASGTRPQLPSSALASMKSIIDGSDYQIRHVAVSSPVVAIIYSSPPHFEVVPAWFHTTHGKHNVFKIPGRRDEWVLSCPAAHKGYVTTWNVLRDDKVKPLARLLKAWKLNVGAPISSFYLEMRTAEYCASVSSTSPIYFEIDLRSIMRRIATYEARDMNDPEGIVGRIPACASDEKRRATIRLLNDAVTNLETARDARQAGDRSAYWSGMYRLFGSDFPYPPV